MDADDAPPDERHWRWDAARGDWVEMTPLETLWALLEPDPPPAVRCACFGHSRVCRRCDADGFLLP